MAALSATLRARALPRLAAQWPRSNSSAMAAAMPAMDEVEDYPATPAYARAPPRVMEVRKLSAALGAEVVGVDLSAPMSSQDERGLRALFRQHGVLVFRGQRLGDDLEAHKRFARVLGDGADLEVHPIVKPISSEHPDVTRIVREAGASTRFGEVWHSDNSFQERPSMGSVLAAVEVPPYGNDTLFSSQVAAYDALSPALKAQLRQLRAVHSAGAAYSRTGHREASFDGKAAMKYKETDLLNAEVLHPVVRTHVASGRLALYVNSMFTSRFEGWTEEESAPLLKFLFDHAAKPEFTCRVTWSPGTVAAWDNRVTQHLAIGDNTEHRRVMHRVTVEGERPM